MSKFRLAYTAYPIDQNPAASSAWFHEFIDRAIATFKECELIAMTFSPGDAFTIERGTKVGPEVERVNMFAQSQADLTIAFLPRDVPSVGVPVEVARAGGAGQPVVVFTDTNSWSLAGIADRPNMGVFALTEKGLDDAVGWLMRYDPDGSPVTSETTTPLPVLLLGETSRMPTRGHEDDAGLDLYVSETTVIEPGEFADVACGIAVELPAGTWGLLTGRSSTLRKRNLLVHTGIIDVGYRGPLYAGVWNMGSERVVVAKDERLAQLIVLPNITEELKPERATELAKSARGEAGFGSTGS